MPLTKPQDSLNPSPNMMHRAKVQLEIQCDDSLSLDNNGIKLMQIIVGSALCLERMIDNAILFTCNDAGSE